MLLTAKINRTAFAFLYLCESPKQKIHGLIYLNLQKVVQLLTCGRKGLRSAELKVPQLILCSGKNQTTGSAKGPRKKETWECFPHIKIWSLCSLSSLSYSIHWIIYIYIHKTEDFSIKVRLCLIHVWKTSSNLHRKRSFNVYGWLKPYSH